MRATIVPACRYCTESIFTQLDKLTDYWLVGAPKSGFELFVRLPLQLLSPSQSFNQLSFPLLHLRDFDLSGAHHFFFVNDFGLGRGGTKRERAKRIRQTYLVHTY